MKELNQDIDLLREFTDEEVAQLASIAERRTYAAGDVILRQGAPADAVYVLLGGAVRVTALLGAGDDLVQADEEVLVRLKEGEVFGELSFITGTPPNLSVIAEEPTSVVALPQPRLHELIDGNASICRKLLFAITRALVGRLRDTGRELVLTRYFIRGR